MDKGIFFCKRLGDVCIFENTNVSSHLVTDNSIINSILANGGWCQLHHSNKIALINVVGGRLLFYNEELLFLEKFDLHTNTLNGYFVILTKTKQRLEKATWIKKILTTGGKIIHDSKMPEAIYAETLHGFLHKLKSSKELHTLKLIDSEVTGRISEFSDSEVTIEILSLVQIPEKIKIHFSNIVCFELRTQKIKHIV